MTQVSLSCDLGRNTTEELVQQLRRHMQEQGKEQEQEQDFVGLVEIARDLYLGAKTKEMEIAAAGDVEERGTELELLVAKLDHMRSVTSYLSTLERCKLLQLNFNLCTYMFSVFSLLSHLLWLGGLVSVR